MQSVYKTMILSELLSNLLLLYTVLLLSCLSFPYSSLEQATVVMWQAMTCPTRMFIVDVLPCCKGAAFGNFVC